MGSGVGSAATKVGIKNLPESINYIWEEYIADSKNNSLLSYEMNQKTLTYSNKSLAFDYLIKGDQNRKNLPLYIILHNGGISQPSYNNGEFLKARFRYQSCIQTGIICGVRGVTDLSNMHYSKESIILLDRLIKSFIVFYKADPDRVYLIGLGFGGDGVYQIINLIPSRFAAAVVISGHSYGKILKNLLNVHLLIQVGENDTFFDKNKDAVKTYKRIKQHYENFRNKCKQLSKYSVGNQSGKNNNNFISNIPSSSNTSSKKNTLNLLTSEKTCVECYLHTGQEQVINDFDKKLQEFPIIADPIQWMISDKENESINQNTNSISFLNKFVREPLPRNLFWDLTCTIAIPITYPNKTKEENNLKDITMIKDSRSGGEGFFNGSLMTSNKDKDEKNLGNSVMFNKYFYWLEIGGYSVQSLGTLEVIARYDPKNNNIFIDTPIKYIRILLNERMVDFNKDIAFHYNGMKQSIKVTRNYQTERRTLAERGDYTYIFSAAVIFESKDMNTFKVSQFEEV